MANAAKDYGFVFHESLVGPGAPHLIECAALTAASNLFKGDPVKYSGSADSEGRASITVAAAGDTSMMGIVVSVLATGPDGLSKLHSDSADTILVCPVLPFYRFRINASNTTGARLNDIGLLFDHFATAGDTSIGVSRYALDMGEDTSAGATTGRSWRLVAFDRREDNEFSTTVTTDTADVDLIVECVESIYNYGVSGTVGEGV